LITISYVHDKLVETRSLAYTLSAINALNPVLEARRKGTSVEALEAAAMLDLAEAGSPRRDLSRDEELADRYRLALASLIKRSWQKRRKVTTETIQDLECYTEAEPRIGKDGFYDLTPKECERDRECCLAERLKANRDALVALRASIPENSTRYEDRNRRKVLKQLINTPKIAGQGSMPLAGRRGIRFLLSRGRCDPNNQYRRSPAVSQSGRKAGREAVTHFGWANFRILDLSKDEKDP